MSDLRVFVKVEERSEASRYVPFETEQLRIGRRPDGNDLVLERKSVSRKHLMLARKDGRFVVADLRSAGGTFVNGLRVTAPVVIRPGDRIVVGEYVLSLVLEGPETDSAAFDERTPSEGTPDPTDARDDVTFGDVGEGVSLHHAGGGSDHDRFRREVLQQAFANMPSRPAPSEADRREGVGIAASSPRVFPGGDTGALTVAVAAGLLAERGAEVSSLHLDMVFEEGLSLQEVHRFLRSIRSAAWDEKITVVPETLHVVEPGVVPGALFRFRAQGSAVLPAPDRVRPGDVLVLSGLCGAHGAALQSMRSQASLSGDLFSDAASTSLLVNALGKAGIAPHHLAFPFQGGVCHALHTAARRWRVRILVREGSGYLDAAAEAAALRLNLDPLFEPSAGRLLALVAPADVTSCVKAWQAAGAQPVVFGEVMGEDELGSVVIGTPSRYKPLRRYQHPEGDL